MTPSNIVEGLREASTQRLEQPFQSGIFTTPDLGMELADTCIPATRSPSQNQNKTEGSRARQSQ